MKIGYDNQIFADNINYYLKRNHLKKNEFANIMDVSVSLVTRWTRGENIPRMDKLEIMASYFGITISDLISKRMKETDPIKEQFIALYDMIPQDKKASALEIFKSIVKNM